MALPHSPGSGERGLLLHPQKKIIWPVIHCYNCKLQFNCTTLHSAICRSKLHNRQCCILKFLCNATSSSHQSNYCSQFIIHPSISSTSKMSKSIVNFNSDTLMLKFASIYYSSFANATHIQKVQALEK